jgi:hypothetical protein
MIKVLALVLLLTGCASTYDCAKDLSKPLSSCHVPTQPKYKCEVPIVNKTTGRVTCTTRADLYRVLGRY